jgi:tetratricopeptide (TPR) repeat protein
MRIVFILLFALASGAYAQNQTKKPAQQQAPNAPAKPVSAINPLIEHFAKKDALANRWNDLEQAKDALYDLIAEYPGNDSLIYTLAIYYYENRQYVSAVLVSQDLLTNNPKNTNVLQLSASGYEALGLKEKALPNYESIYLITGSTAALYKMAVIQFDLKKYAESTINADILLTKTDLDSLKITLADAENKQKEYPIKASILNLKGLLAQQNNDKIAAKKAFEDALVASPEFPPAKQNLAKLK